MTGALGFVWKKVPGNPHIWDVERKARAKGLLVVGCGQTMQVRNPNGKWLQFMVYDTTLMYRDLVWPKPSAVAIGIRPTPTFRCERCARMLPLREQAATIRSGIHKYPLCLSCLEAPGLLGALQAADYQVTVRDT